MSTRLSDEALQDASRPVIKVKLVPAGAVTTPLPYDVASVPFAIAYNFTGSDKAGIHERVSEFIDDVVSARTIRHYARPIGPIW
jgi:hypothetical protein